VAAVRKELRVVLVLALDCEIPAMIGVIGLKSCRVPAIRCSRARNDERRYRRGSNEGQDECCKGGDHVEYRDLNRRKRVQIWRERGEDELFVINE
jgi:hypothetical protein